MADYKKLYCKMFSASTKALHIIQQAQIECENMYLEMTENENNALKVLKMNEYNNAEIISLDDEDDDFIDIDPQMYEFGE